MADESTPAGIDLETFLRSAGQSFTEAQRALVPGLDVSVNMMLSNAELELKVTVSSDAQGKMSIRPISSEEISRGGIDPGMLSTLRISFVSSIGELEVKPQPAPTTENTGGGNKVPALLGLTMNEAVTLLKSGGWQFEPHAASSEEVAIAGKERLGRVLRQQPATAQSVDKAKTTVHFWVDLGNTPIKEIDGIGASLSDRLSQIGITTVGELGLASITQIASALRMSESRAQGFIDMAMLMSHIAVIDSRDEVVELLVKGAGIRSTEQLAKVDPAELFRVCQEAIASGKVRVPRGFRLTADEVKRWITAIKSTLGE